MIRQTDELAGYLTIQAAAKLINKTYWQVLDAAKRRRTPLVRIGQRVLLIKLEDLRTLK